MPTPPGEQEGVIEAIFASLPGQVAVIDRTGEIIAVNDNWLASAALGGAAAESVGRGAKYLDACERSVALGDVSAKSVLHGIQAVLQGTRTEYTVEYLCHVGAPVRWYRMQCVALARPAGSALICHTEITENRLHEEHAHRLLYDFARSERGSVMGELAASMMHELAQPLTAVLSNAEAIQRLARVDQTSLEALRAPADDVVANAEKAAEVAERLRTLVREDRLNLQTVDLATLTRGSVQMLESSLRFARIGVILDLAPDTPSIAADSRQIQQVIFNLIMNALEAMGGDPPGGRRLFVETGASEGGAWLRIRDNGPGVDPILKERIFDPFYTTKPEGMGIGLRIARLIARAHGGDIELEETVQRGASFVLRLGAAG